MKESDDLTPDWADELVRDMVEEEIAAEVRKRREETALCVSQITLHEQAALGWKPEWQRSGHNPACEHCRRAARVTFRNENPGFRTLADRNHPDRPEWWRGAIADYLAEAPPIVKGIAAASSLAADALSAIGEIVRIDLRGIEHALPVARTKERGVSFEGMNYDGMFEEPEWVGSSYSDDGIFATLYRRDSRKKIDGQPAETTFFLLVEDDRLRPRSMVQVGLAGEALSFIRTIEIKKGYEDRCRGELEIPLAEMRKLIGQTGQLLVMPAKVLTEEEEREEREAREFRDGAES